MARASTSSAPNPYWCTPKRLLAIFRVINLINYLDRGAIASNGVNGSCRMCFESGARSSGSGIQGDFDPRNFEYGVISSAFMVGTLCSISNICIFSQYVYRVLSRSFLITS